MALLLDGDLRGASALVGAELTADFTTEGACWLWRYRLGQMAADPSGTPWMTRLVAVGPDSVAVGHAGFHGPPDASGMAEVGYVVSPEFRRRGHARAMLAELMRLAAASPAVTTVRACVSPSNVASLATIAPFGFAEVGEQWDDIDGRELIFEVRSGR